MSAIIFIVERCCRWRCSWFWRAAAAVDPPDFRNPICQAVVRITNPLILPLRRVLPPVGKLDTASVVAVLVIARSTLPASSRCTASASASTPVGTAGAHRDRAHAAVDLSVRDFPVRAAQSHRPGRLLAAAVAAHDLERTGAAADPAADPAVAGLDLSPLWAIIAIQAVLILMR